MNGRGGVVGHRTEDGRQKTEKKQWGIDRGIFFLFLFFSLIILLQILSMIQSDRFYDELNGLDETFEGAAVYETKGEFDGGYSGDEGDWLIWSFRVEPKTLNRICANGDVYCGWVTTPNIFEPLLVYDFDETKLIGRLAESYEISSGWTEITFRLRDDIHFSDGAVVTTDDVIFTYETIMNPAVDAAEIAERFVDVEKVVRVDERVVKFFMKDAYFKALEDVSFWGVGILPKHIYEFSDADVFNKRRTNPVGSGPYVFERWQTGREIVLRRNEKYWGARPKLEKLVYRFISNTSAGIASLRSHQVDIVIPEPEQFADLVGDAEFNEDFECLSYWNPGVPFFYVGWNQDTAFFSDRRVRLAMTQIINREQIVEHLLDGNGCVITGPFYVNGAQNDAGIESWSYNPAKAAGLLEEAGWVDSDGDGVRDKDGRAFRFKFMYSGSYVLYERLARLLKDEAAKVGIEVVPEPYEWSVVAERLNDRDFDSVVMNWAGGIVEDPYRMWHSSQIGGGGANYVGFNNQKADIIIEEIRKTFDEDKRNGLYHQLGRIIHEEQPCSFLFTRPSFRLLDRRFENVIIHNLGLKYLEWYVPREQQRYK